MHFCDTCPSISSIGVNGIAILQKSRYNIAAKWQALNEPPDPTHIRGLRKFEKRNFLKFSTSCITAQRSVLCNSKSSEENGLPIVFYDIDCKNTLFHREKWKNKIVFSGDRS